MHALTAKNALPPLNVYSVALYPKANAPPTVTTKLINDKMWEFIAFTKKKKKHQKLVIYANKVLEKNLPYTCNMNIHMYISLISIMIFNITYIYINISDYVPWFHTWNCLLCLKKKMITSCISYKTTQSANIRYCPMFLYRYMRLSFLFQKKI